VRARKKAVRTKSRKVVSVIGIWHLGAVNAVGFAEKGYTVLGLEFDKKKATCLQKGKPPLFEPGLESMMTRHLKKGSLRFDSDPKAVATSDYVVIAYDSPVNEQDEVDVTPVLKAAEVIAPYLRSNTPVVITSQLPLGTSEKIEARIRSLSPTWESGVVYSPENLRLGTAIPRFLDPDMLVLGANQPQALKSALALYQPFHTAKLPMDLRSAEMVKHALNTFLATSITFINEIAGLADRLGADAVAVGQALKLDKRIGSKALMMPGLGFSGGTLARDVIQLRKFAAERGYTADLLDSILRVNERTFEEILVKLKSALGKLAGKRIGILGLTYKAGTSTIRRSPGIKLIEMLRKAKATCLGYDPKADFEELSHYRHLFERAKKIHDLVKDADGLVLVTEWPEFKDLPFQSLAKLMKTAVMIDSKNYLDPDLLASAGFDYQGFGRRRRSKRPEDGK
jgi:UDPglucose 6-dehydrogenase